MRTLIGHAVSDCNHSQRNLKETLSQMDTSEAIELQPEYEFWDISSALPILDKYLFKSVHAPCQRVDLSSLNLLHRASSVDRTIESMNIADKINADSFVLHPVQAESFISPEERDERRGIFLEVFRSYLIKHYDKEKHRYKISFENLEYSKFPATFEELIGLADECSSYLPVSLTVDIPHIWNSNRILRKTPDLLRNMKGYDGLYRDLPGYVSDMILRHYNSISHFHIANFRVDENLIKTHDPITQNSTNQDLIAIIPMLKGKPIILEVYNSPLRICKESERNVKLYLRE